MVVTSEKAGVETVKVLEALVVGGAGFPIDDGEAGDVAGVVTWKIGEGCDDRCTGCGYERDAVNSWDGKGR